MSKIIISGGAGFIGSHVFEKIISDYPNEEILVIDKMTYASSFSNINKFINNKNINISVGDLCDFDFCKRVTKNADIVINLAAESHVDNSFESSIIFSKSNVVGTHSLLEASRINKIKLFIHVSTDEVYGEIKEGFHTENDHLNPTNPYSASKAAAEMIVNGYLHSFKMPIIVVRANNIYGIRQYPEKIIPKFIMQSLCNVPFTIHGDGLNTRKYLSALDFADAISILIKKGKIGEIYNIGSTDEYKNLEIIDLISKETKNQPSINFVRDRPFNDCRYSVSCKKLENLGWHQKRHLYNDLPNIINWYKNNLEIYRKKFQ